jgi:hypothetical protein
MFLFKCYQYDTDRGIRVDCHHGLVKKKKRGRLHNINDVFISSKYQTNVLYIYILFFRNDYNRVDWLSVVKFKSRSLVQVVENANNEVIGGDVFQMDDLVDPYRPPPYAKLKKSKFSCH